MESFMYLDYKELKDDIIRPYLHPLLQIVWPFLETHEGHGKCCNCGKNTYSRWKEWGGGVWLLESKHVLEIE